MTTLRRVLLLLATALLTGGLWPGLGQAATIIDDTSDYVTFANDDGQWTIYKRCVGTDTPNGVGPAYITRFVTNAGYTAVNGIGNGGAGETNNPARAGLGIFHWAHARGAGPYDWNRSWNMSNRRCAFDSSGFGVSQVSPPYYGIDGASTGYYDQDVYFSDSWTSPNKLLWVRYRWRFDNSGVRLYAMVVQDCTWGSCGSTGDIAYVKGPKFAANLNGQLSSTRPVHMSTFDGNGKWLGNCNRLVTPRIASPPATSARTRRAPTRPRTPGTASTTGGCAPGSITAPAPPPAAATRPASAASTLSPARTRSPASTSSPASGPRTGKARGSASTSGRSTPPATRLAAAAAAASKARP